VGHVALIVADKCKQGFGGDSWEKESTWNTQD